MKDLANVMFLEFPIFETAIHMNFYCNNLPSCGIQSEQKKIGKDRHSE